MARIVNLTKSLINIEGTCGHPLSFSYFQRTLDRARYVHPFSVTWSSDTQLSIPVWRSAQCSSLYIAILKNTYRQRASGYIVRTMHVTPKNTAGHNKWSKIKHKKAVTDHEKSKMRGKLVDLIRTAVAHGGSDPTTNIKLAGLLTRAKSSGIPKSNIEAALKSASGAGGSVRETVVYEGRGPSGYLLLIEAVTDNRNRTRPEIRHIIEKQGYVHCYYSYCCQIQILSTLVILSDTIIKIPSNDGKPLITPPPPM